MTAEPRDGLTIRAALLLAFGLVLGLWLSAGYSLARRMNDVERAADQINTRYIRTQELLGAIRTNILLASLFVRDALLDLDPGATTGYRQQFEHTFAAIDSAVRNYEPVFDSPAERLRIERLHVEIAAYRTAMHKVFAGDTTTWIPDAHMLLRGQSIPRRDSVIRVSEELQGLNRGAFIEHQDATADMYRSLQRRLWTQLGMAVAASFVIGLVAVRHVTKLEDRLRAQRAREMRYSRDLQRLSTRLVSAQEEERRRIARELHDEVGQLLTALKVELALAERGGESGATNGPLVNARQMADGALKTVRDLSRLLRPAVLDDLGLPAALEALVRDVSTRHGVRGEIVQDTPARRLTQPLEVAIYRIAQEALTNVVRHSGAKTFQVALRRSADTVSITVEDDGVGFEPTTSGWVEGLGLLGIRERAAQLRGTMQVQSAVGCGTRVCVKLPASYRDAAEPHQAARTGIVAAHV